MFTKHIIVEVTGDMAIVMQVIFFEGSPVKRLFLNAEGNFVEEKTINMDSDGALYVHAAHIDAAQPARAVDASPRAPRKNKSNKASRN